MDSSKQSTQPTIPFDVVIPPNFVRSREPVALHDTSSLQLDTKNTLGSSRSYTMSSAVSETTSCMTFYSALGASSWNGKPDEAGPSAFNEQRKISGHEDPQLGRSDSGYGSINGIADGQDDFYSEASDLGDSTAKLTERSERSLCLSENSQSVKRDQNARKTRRRSGASDRSRSKERSRTESDPSKTKSSRHPGSSTHRRSSTVDSKNRLGSERPVSKNSSRSLKRASSATSAGTRPAIPARSSSSTFPRRRNDSPVTIQQSRHIFQSLGATLARHDTAHTEPKSVLRPSSASALRHSISTPVGSSILPVPDLPYLMATHIDQNSPHAGSVYLPCTVIDWKSPTTRRREYAEIDKRERGFRGWWRRWSPSWCSKSPRLGFYEGSGDSDAGSVRRYRLELPDEDASTNMRENEKEMNVAAGKTRFPWQRMSRSWSCFNLSEGPSRRWLSTVALTKGRNSPYPQAVWG